ncbi:MAG: metallophosphoesterase [Pyrinomonadaceae bacterium]
MRKLPLTKLRVFFLTLILVIVALGAWAFFIEPDRLVIHQQVIKLTQLPSEFAGTRIAVIGDIHAGAPFITPDKLQQIVLEINEQHPDLVVLLGDYMVRGKFYQHPIDPQVTADACKQLRAPLGVYAVLGNHDWWYDGLRVRNAFQNASIRVLDNEVAEVRRVQQSIFVIGLADAWTRPQRIAETVAKVPAGATAIAITHNPDVFPDIPETVELTLAAHTHGGQVNFPLLGRLVVPSSYGQRYAAGLIHENRKQLFVTTGIGTSILPVRFRVPPEIAILTLQ